MLVARRCPDLGGASDWLRGLSNTPTNLCMALYSLSHNNTVQKYNNKESGKTIRNLAMLCINLSEYWTSMSVETKFPRISTSRGRCLDLGGGASSVWSFCTRCFASFCVLLVVFRTSFCGGSGGDLAKRRLFSQAKSRAVIDMNDSVEGSTV